MLAPTFIAILLAFTCQSPAPNLAPNGQFLRGNDIPSDWTNLYRVGGALKISRDTKTFFHAPASLSLTGLDELADGNVSADLPEIAGKTILFDGVVRGDGAITEAQVALFTLDEKMKQLEWRPLASRWDFRQGLWSPFHAKVSIPGNAKYAKLILYIKGKGTVWLGEISARDQNPTESEKNRFTIKPTVAPMARSQDSPTIVGIGAIAPSVLAIEINAGHIVPSSLSIYHPSPSDQRIPNGHHMLLKVNGREIGWLMGDKNDHLVTYEHLLGDPLQKEYADWLGSYRVSSTDDPEFNRPQLPTAIFRKSKPNDWEQPQKRFAMTHRIYLQLARPLLTGKHYTIHLGDVNVAKPDITFVFDPKKQTSEAVHVSQVGYRPHDPFKRAYLSCWRGTGGGQTYPDHLTFKVIDQRTQMPVYSGEAKVSKLASEPELMRRDENFVKADVYSMDFASVVRTGIYRVMVDGIGSSLPFPIQEDVWEGAFKIQMRGLVNERSGIELKPPFADYFRPADQMPNPGQALTESRASALGGQEAWAALVKGDTGVTVPHAYGGYHDAGDWNPRRVTHLQVSMAHMELLDLFPEWFRSLKLALPDSSNLPDVLQEALWEIDCFKRLQKPDGGIPFALETDGDPEDGDISWLTTQHLYEFAPDAYGSWTYASACARAARLMAAYDAKKASIYRTSALKAMVWAESHYAEEKAELSWDKVDARNLAAVEVYWLTHDPKWHDVYLQDTVLKTDSPHLFQWGKSIQRDSAFVYARLPHSLGIQRLKDRACKCFDEMAAKEIEYGNGNAFNLTTFDKGRPLFVGFYTIADVGDLCRAHFFTHKPEYLSSIVRACQFSTGANPSNMTYTTGLGINPPKNPLFLDTRRTGQPAPKGLTVYGPMDFIEFHDANAIWPIKYFLEDACIPPATQWPIPEAYFDIYLYPMINEFTVDIWAGNVYAWGYLAARKD